MDSPALACKVAFCTASFRTLDELATHLKEHAEQAPAISRYELACESMPSRDWARVGLLEELATDEEGARELDGSGQGGAQSHDDSRQPTL